MPAEALPEPVVSARALPNAPVPRITAAKAAAIFRVRLLRRAPRRISISPSEGPIIVHILKSPRCARERSLMYPKGFARRREEMCVARLLFYSSQPPTARTEGSERTILYLRQPNTPQARRAGAETPGRGWRVCNA